MKKRFLTLLAVMMLLMLTACGNKFEGYYEILSKNYYPEESKKGITQAENTIDFDKNCVEILLNVKVLGGTVKIVIVDEGEKDSKEYEYVLTESQNISIPVDSKTAKDTWKCITEHDEYTDARITIGVNYK